MPRPRLTRAALALLPALAALPACTTTGASTVDDILQPTLWIQTSAERRAISIQTYRSAAQQLRAATAEPRSAVTERDDCAGLPPAVILDVDETVLDNSPFQVGLLEAGEQFSSERWARWAEEGRALAVPGALEFIQTARSLGVEVFYVTNRKATLRAPTAENLRKLGFPVSERTLLLRDAKPEWTSDKSSRRLSVAQTHCVVMLFGDDLNDFVPAKVSLDARETLLQQHTERWGRSWFVLPNPMYGSWLRTLTDFEFLDPEAERAQRMSALRR